MGGMRGKRWGREGAGGVKGGWVVMAETLQTWGSEKIIYPLKIVSLSPFTCLTIPSAQERAVFNSTRGSLIMTSDPTWGGCGREM